MVKKTKSIKLKPMKFKEIERIIKNNKWVIVRATGSHCQYKHPDKKGTVTIACHSSDIPKEIIYSILEQANLLHLIQ